VADVDDEDAGEDEDAWCGSQPVDQWPRSNASLEVASDPLPFEAPSKSCAERWGADLCAGFGKPDPRTPSNGPISTHIRADSSSTDPVEHTHERFHG
jgi:hypothetical protein